MDDLAATQGHLQDDTQVDRAEKASYLTPKSAHQNRLGAELDIHALDATFKRSGVAAFHSWFPYLEGYSPHFVRQVHSSYMPKARHVMDPFVGSGTTPIVLGQEGIDTSYAEANPAMAFVTRTKLNAIAASSRRSSIAKDLRVLATTLDAQQEVTAENVDLKKNYESTFGHSEFFHPRTLKTVLRLRTLNDEISKTHCDVVVDCFTLAVMSALIPCSLLKRAGDLRFRTEKELSRGLSNPVADTSRLLLQMADEIEFLSPSTGKAKFVGSDARQLISDRVVDGVITSPPYLNGTNYIRNARLELWYLRFLTSKKSIRDLRNGVVTSGINDVDASTRHEAVSAGVDKVASQLRVAAYDDRIAKMVGGYFFDMKQVLCRASEFTRTGGAICIDIGDSVYAGIHVPTDDILIEIGLGVGLKLQDLVYLRKRRSNGGQELRQTLIVFRKQAR